MPGILLLTGFEPFGGSKINPSEQIARKLEGCRFGTLVVHSVILPVDKTLGPAQLFRAVDEYQPGVVISLGEAAHRAAISIERVAINLMDYRIPDNSGAQVKDQKIVDDGPDAYFSSLPVRKIYNAILAAGVPVELSLTAGAYLCNQVFYSLQHKMHVEGNIIPAGFIHLPALPEEAAATGQVFPTMALDVSLRAIEIAISAL